MKPLYALFILVVLMEMGCRPKVKKPLIYLYPRDTMEVHVQLDYEGRLTTTYPAYSEETGWRVIAAPDGSLRQSADGKAFYGLYWEGVGYRRPMRRTGFVVKGDETAAFLEAQLELQGLNARERNEFIVYWLPRMQHNPYNFIHFAQEDYRQQARLHIQPEPETLIRVFMEFRALEQPIEVQPQTLTPVQRTGFTVVEWGGVELGKTKETL